MNRRSFLQRLCSGIVGAAAVAHVPSNWIPSTIHTIASAVPAHGTYGAINRATFSFWRNQDQSYGTAFDNLQMKMREGLDLPYRHEDKG